MKKLIAILVFLLIGFTAYAETSTNYYHRVGGYFYSNLSPYGTWIEIDYGVVAWRPTIIKRNWAPYKIGRWIWTDYGWYWDSYEPFGYIVFHYGRWYYDDYYGWIWIPDDEWAPAWVEWRYDDDYIGWAPLHPYAVFSINFGIRITYNYYVPYTHWHFVTYKHFCNPYVYNFYVPAKYKYRIYGRTKERYDYKYYNGRVRNEGVDFDFVRKRSGQKIEKRDLITSNDPREFDNISNRDEDRIRTFVADRNEIRRDRETLRDVKIERSERRPSLELEKVELAEIKRNRSNDRNDAKDRPIIEMEKNVKRDDKIRERNDSDYRNRNNDTRDGFDKRSYDEQERSRTNDSRNLERRKEVEVENKLERSKEYRTDRNDSHRNENRTFEMKRNDGNVNEQRNEVKRNQQFENRNFEQKRTETRSIESKRTDNKNNAEINRDQNQNRSNNSDRRQNTSRTEKTR